MTIDIDHWADRYENDYSESVEYLDASGSSQVDTDPLFSGVSAAFNSRSEVTKEELIEIGKWKAPTGRITHYLRQNSSTSVRNWSITAFHASSEYATIDSLLTLKGVGVPVASSILAMWNPADYAVIDFRALRALAAANPDILYMQPYDELIQYFDALRGYNRSIEAYQFYLEHVREIARDQDVPARKVEMALWKYDKETSQ